MGSTQMAICLVEELCGFGPDPEGILSSDTG